MERGTHTQDRGQEEEKKRTGKNEKGEMLDTGGTSDDGIFFTVEGRLLCHLMESYKLRSLYLNK